MGLLTFLGKMLENGALCTRAAWQGIIDFGLLWKIELFFHQKIGIRKQVAEALFFPSRWDFWYDRNEHRMTERAVPGAVFPKSRPTARPVPDASFDV
ncbi:hypothetical protein [Sulfobacillus harzensis]|uniref:Uncharacterized protein n=1 Tax=Sulfobacillus harzensis TaxID=2729629 RepID=A0A7Y0L071_9FIRM|nr:hypothetical protein [Sulfobacillus harzensis]NMP20847.1 hypothetical protein [Sulfobacillus harzensis]